MLVLPPNLTQPCPDLPSSPEKPWSEDDLIAMIIQDAELYHDCKNRHNKLVEELNKDG